MAIALHMDPEIVHVCVQQFGTECDAIRQLAQALAVQARSVDWYGASREEFQFELERLAVELSLLADQGDVLAARVQREIEEWQQTDSYFVEQFLKVIIPNNKKG